MSLSISRHSDGSITYCDEFESDDDVIQGTATSQPRAGHTSLILGERCLETSTPKVRLPHSKVFDKGNSSVQSDDSASNKRRRNRALGMLCLENQSLVRNGKMSAMPQKKIAGGKSSKRATMSFDIFRPDTGDSPEKSFGQCKTPITARASVSVGLLSPEYEPAGFFDRVRCKVENESFSPATDSISENEEQTEQLVEMFPNADPAFLKSESNRMKAPLGDVVSSILSHMEKNQMPRKDSRKEVEESGNRGKKFSVVQLLKTVRDPWSYFGDKERDCTGYSDHSLHYLKTKFRKFYNQTITDALLFHNQNLYLADKYLKKKNRGLKLRMTNRPMSECNACKPNTVNLQFLFEVSFIEHEEQVKNYVRTQKAAKKLRLKEAARLGLLVECECCYGENLLPEDVVTCNARHTFCKECIASYIETGLGNGVSHVQCLGPCREEYPLQVIQEVLTPVLFSNLMKIWQPPDVAYLAQCPFCSYMMYLPPDITFVNCLNIQCLKESCRLCKGPNHEPMKCAVSAPISKQCWQCEREVMKEAGCNEMVCSCGGKTCYVCSQPVQDHSHFFLYDDEDGSKCPLYSTD